MDYNEFSQRIFSELATLGWHNVTISVEAGAYTVDIRARCQHDDLHQVMASFTTLSEDSAAGLVIAEFETRCALQPPVPTVWVPLSNFQVSWKYMGNQVVNALAAVCPAVSDSYLVCPGTNEVVVSVAGDIFPCLVQGSLSTLIPHLNDTHCWTREKIADWLETLPLDLTIRPKENNDDDANQEAAALGAGDEYAW